MRRLLSAKPAVFILSFYHCFALADCLKQKTAGLDGIVRRVHRRKAHSLCSHLLVGAYFQVPSFWHQTNATSKINLCITLYCRNRVYCWQEGGIWGELDYLWISPLWHRKVTFLLYLGPNISTLQSQINKKTPGFTSLKYTTTIFCERVDKISSQKTIILRHKIFIYSYLPSESWDGGSYFPHKMILTFPYRLDILLQISYL